MFQLLVLLFIKQDYIDVKTLYCFQKPCVPNKFVGVHFTLCMQFVAPCYSLLIAIKIYSNSTVIYQQQNTKRQH